MRLGSSYLPDDRRRKKKRINYDEVDLDELGQDDKYVDQGHKPFNCSHETVEEETTSSTTTTTTTTTTTPKPSLMTAGYKETIDWT